MSNLSTIVKQPSGALMTAEQADAIRTALKTSLYPGASDESVDMVLAYCRAGGLDPMTKPVHIVPLWIPEKKQGNLVITPAGMRDVIMPGIELYRTKAHRTGEYAGQDEAEFGPTVEANLSNVIVRYPEWCRVTVYRLVAGERVPYSAKVYWLETYATAKRDTDAPNAMWRKRPFGQLEKCAEALALRKAFPEAVGAQPTAEEMEGKSLVAEVVQAPPSRLELQPYPETDFDANLPKWRGVIESGRKSADEIITMVETKGVLSEAQIKAIRACEVTQQAEAEAEAEGELA